MPEYINGKLICGDCAEDSVINSIDDVTLTPITVSSNDIVLVKDTSDSNTLKGVTASQFLGGGAPEGTAVLSTGEVGGNKYLREDGDGTCSWQTVAGGSGGTAQGVDGTYDIQPTNEGATAGNARGENSVDLCTSRSDANYVCAGANSGALGGQDVGGTGTHTAYLAGLSNYGNTGNYCSISGSNNYNNSGNYCLISGYRNYSNSGTHCSISGEDNNVNTGVGCLISGTYNSNISGNYCNISGQNNYYNSGSACSISGYNNNYNSGTSCSISGEGNQGNFGTHSNISGYVTSGSTKIATSGTSADAGTNLITKTSHGILANQPIRFTTLTGGTGLSTGTTYYARDILTDTFAVSALPGGSAVNITVNYTVANYIANAINCGNYNIIAGQDNEGNSGNHCNISGYGNYNNSTDWNLISGRYNYSNSGYYCSISGSYHYDNSGYSCSISGFRNYSNSGWNCLISGTRNHSNSGHYCLIFGYNNSNNTGNFCSISGYANTSNSGRYCSISGYYAKGNNLDYAVVHAGGKKARIIDLVAKASTTNATPKAITLGGVAEGAAGSIIIPADTAWAFTVHVVAIDITGGFANSKKFSFDGLVLNDGGTVTVTSQTLGTDTTIGTFTGSVALSADATYGALRIMATGIAATTIRWTARIELTQVN